MAIVSIDYIEGLKRLYDPDTGEHKVLFLASSDGKDKANVMPFTSWAISHVDPQGWCIAVYVFTGHFTHELIDQTKQFTVNAPRNAMDEIIECCGSMSGRNHDKFKECGLTAVASCYVAPPIIEECIAHFECEVYNSYPFTMTFPGTDRAPRGMTVFEGRILAAHADEDDGHKIPGTATSKS
jgi:flavin reductase (DIM6/NTAB) family NADH-FMN oxidoreductase RutF